MDIYGGRGWGGEGRDHYSDCQSCTKLYGHKWEFTYVIEAGVPEGWEEL